MNSDSTHRRSWLRRNQNLFYVGIPLLYIALAPFPGLGMIYPIHDYLRGHPHRAHGTQPSKFVGLWIRDRAEEFDFRGQAFYLMPDGKVVGMPGMVSRHWHFDQNRFFVDSVSLCGTCFRGNETAEHMVSFVGADHLAIANLDKTATRGISGEYRRFEINGGLKAKMKALSGSKDADEGFKARTVLRVIEHLERFDPHKITSR